MSEEERITENQPSSSPSLDNTNKLTKIIVKGALSKSIITNAKHVKGVHQIKIAPKTNTSDMNFKRIVPRNTGGIIMDVIRSGKQIIIHKKTKKIKALNMLNQSSTKAIGQDSQHPILIREEADVPSHSQALYKSSTPSHPQALFKTDVARGKIPLNDKAKIMQTDGMSSTVTRLAMKPDFATSLLRSALEERAHDLKREEKKQMVHRKKTVNSSTCQSNIKQVYIQHSGQLLDKAVLDKTGINMCDKIGMDICTVSSSSTDPCEDQDIDESGANSNDKSDVEANHYNCEFCPPCDHNYARCVLLESEQCSVSSEHENNFDADGLHNKNFLEDCNTAEEYSTSFKTSEKGEQVMVVNPSLDDFREKDPVHDSNVGMVDFVQCFNKNIKKRRYRSVNSVSRQATSTSKVDLLSGRQFADPQADRDLEPLNRVVGEIDSSCHWKIDSVYSIAPESFEGDDRMKDGQMDFITKCKETEERPKEKVEAAPASDSSNESSQEQFCKPCFVVLQRSSIEYEKRKPQIADIDIASKCSHYCRTRALNLLCSMNLLDCCNQPVIKKNCENVEEGKIPKLPTASPSVSLFVKETDSKLSSPSHSGDIKSQLTTRQTMKKHSHDNGVGPNEKFKQALRQLRFQIAIKRKHMYLKKKSNKVPKIFLPLPTIQGVPVDPVSFVKSVGFSQSQKKRFITKRSRNTEIPKGDLKEKHVGVGHHGSIESSCVPASSAPSPAVSQLASLLTRNKPALTPDQAPESIPHKVFSVSKTGAEMRLLPSSTPNPIPHYKLKAALESLTKHLQSNPQSCGDGKGNFNYFLVKIDNQQVLLKTTSIKFLPSSSGDNLNSLKFILPKNDSETDTQPCSSKESDTNQVTFGKPIGDSTQIHEIRSFPTSKDKQILPVGKIGNIKKVSKMNKCVSKTALSVPSCSEKRQDSSSVSSQHDLSLSKHGKNATPNNRSLISSNVTKYSCPQASSSEAQVKRPLSLPLTEEQKRIKRRKLEAKYPLPPGVIIKSEPITQGYDLDNNWSVTSEIDMGYIEQDDIGQVQSPSLIERDPDDSRSHLPDCFSNQSPLDIEIEDDLPPLLEDATSWSSHGYDGNLSAGVKVDAPPILQPMAPSSSFTDVVVDDPIMMTDASDEVAENNSETGTLNELVTSPVTCHSESDYDSPSTSSSFEFLAMPSSSSTSLPCDNKSKKPPIIKSKIQQLKELLKQKEMQVENMRKIRSTLPQIDLDSV